MPSSMILENRPQMIYTFRINNLNQNKKAKFNNEIYGRRKGKYNYKGLLDRVGGRKLSSGCVLVSCREIKKIEKLFIKFKVKYERLKIWK